MFGNILIDKLKFNIKEVDEDVDYGRLANRIKKILSNYFEANAVHVSRSRHELKVNITPTRFKVNKYYTDVNLEMISKEKFRSVFNKIGLSDEIISQARIVEIHLTKNIIVNEKPVNYIQHLGERKYRHFNPFICISNKNGQTLYLSTPANKSSTKDYTGDRKFLFYDKSAYLNERHKGLVYLKYFLKKSEKRMITTIKNPTDLLHMGLINVLRAELQYKNSGKVCKIAKFIDDNKSYTKFPLSLFLKQLNEGSLYENLDKFYTCELREYVFFNKIDNEASKSTRLEGLFDELISKVNNISTLQSLYGDSHQKQFRKLIRESQKSNTHKLYRELYEKLMIAS